MRHTILFRSQYEYGTVYPKKYAHGFCFAVLCCGYTLTDFPISIRLTSLALWQSNDCPSASRATLMNMDKYFLCIHYERLHNHNKAKHNKTVCIFLGIYCNWVDWTPQATQLVHQFDSKPFPPRVPSCLTRRIKALWQQTTNLSDDIICQEQASWQQKHWVTDIKSHPIPGYIVHE